ncbi:MAG: hypothetical protein GXY86_00340 [Firmicutes bacterium]|nr:hypothetical protein [Bacillota bacterium]
MNNGVLRNESTQEGRNIWRAVDNAAAKAPNWVKKQIEGAPITENKQSSLLPFNYSIVKR